MDKDRRNSRRAIAGNLVFIVLAAIVLGSVKVLHPAIPLWILLTIFALSCLGLLGDLINLMRRRP